MRVTAHACSTGLDGTSSAGAGTRKGSSGVGPPPPARPRDTSSLPSGPSSPRRWLGPINCMTGTDSNMYCWGNASDDRTGKILNSDNTVIQYENFTDNSRNWVSNYPNSYMNGPARGPRLHLQGVLQVMAQRPNLLRRLLRINGRGRDRLQDAGEIPRGQRVHERVHEVYAVTTS